MYAPSSLGMKWQHLLTFSSNPQWDLSVMPRDVSGGWGGWGGGGGLEPMGQMLLRQLSIKNTFLLWIIKSSLESALCWWNFFCQEHWVWNDAAQYVSIKHGEKKVTKKSGIIIRGFAVWCGTEEHISEVLSQQNLEYCSDILRCLWVDWPLLCLWCAPSACFFLCLYQWSDVI